MFVPVTSTGFRRSLSRPIAAGASLSLRWFQRQVLRWNLVATLCLLGSTAVAETSEAPAPVPPQPTTGDAWLPNQGQGASQVQGQVSTTPGVAIPSTPPTAPTSATAATAPANPNVTPTTQAPNQDALADADPEALTMFRPDLDPYGNWIDDPRYGRIWVPRRDVVGSGFSPYVTSGHWALDGDDNWVWVSDYPFGNVVFHYGRWFYSTEYGWAWVPGRTYAPSWVAWRTPTSSTYAYVGWAPMPPRFGWFSTGVVWYSSMPAVSYVFCPSDYLFYPSVGIYIVHDPWLVGRLGFYTAVYYPPYGYYGWGYHGWGYGGVGYHHTHYYGPPVYRTGISPRAVPRDRIASQPRIAAMGARTAAASSGMAPTMGRSGGRMGATPSIAAAAPRSSSSFAAPRTTTSWTAARTSPLARPSTAASLPSRSIGFGSTSARPAGPSTWSAPRTTRSTSSWSAPRSTMSVSPRSSSSFSAPSFHSAPSVRSPSFHSSPSFHGSSGFRSGGRHR